MIKNKQNNIRKLWKTLLSVGHTSCVQCSFIEQVMKLLGGNLPIDFKQFHALSSNTRLVGREKRLKNTRHREVGVVQEEERSVPKLQSQETLSHPQASPV